jgi:hypothetical protein
MPRVPVPVPRAPALTCEEIREDSVFEDTAFATVYIGVAWLLVAGVIFGTWMLIARARR